MNIMKMEKNIKKKWEEDKEEFKGSDNESEELENRRESNDTSGATQKKHQMFKLQKDTSNYKLEVEMYFSTKDDFKETITS